MILIDGLFNSGIFEGGLFNGGLFKKPSIITIKSIIPMLFGVGEQGLIYDISDFSTMFQDSAATTPVTAVAQPVGKILDLSGNNNHAYQETAASRPMLRQDGGGYYYLEFDGVDDILITSSVDLTGTNDVAIFTGERPTGGGSYPMVICSSSYPDSNAGSFRADLTYSTSKYVLQCRGTTTRTIKETASGFSFPSTNVTYRKLQFGTVSSVAMRVNAADQELTNLSTNNPVVGPYGNYPVYIGNRGYLSSNTRFAGRIYSLIVIGRIPTAQEISSTETWINSKTGAY